MSVGKACGYDVTVLSPMGSGAHFEIVGNYLYVAISATDLLKIYDITNPASPSLLSSTSLGVSKGPNEICVRGNYAFMTFYTSSQLAIWDISNPSSPSQTSLTALTGYGAANNPGFLAVSSDGNTAYVGYYAAASPGSGHKAIGKYDTTNKAAPSAGSKWIDSGANAVTVGGLCLVEAFSTTLLFASAFRYSSGSNGNLYFYAITTSTMATAGSCQVGTYFGGSIACGELDGTPDGYFYVSSPAENKIFPINATTPASPSCGTGVSVSTGAGGTVYPCAYRKTTQIWYVGATNGTVVKGVYPVNVATRMSPSIGALISCNSDTVNDIKIAEGECATLGYCTNTGLQQLYLKGNP